VHRSAAAGSKGRLGPVFGRHLVVREHRSARAPQPGLRPCRGSWSSFSKSLASAGLALGDRAVLRSAARPRAWAPGAQAQPWGVVRRAQQHAAPPHALPRARPARCATPRTCTHSTRSCWSGLASARECW